MPKSTARKISRLKPLQYAKLSWIWRQKEATALVCSFMRRNLAENYENQKATWCKNNFVILKKLRGTLKTWWKSEIALMKIVIPNVRPKNDEIIRKKKKLQMVKRSNEKWSKVQQTQNHVTRDSNLQVSARSAEEATNTCVNSEAKSPFSWKFFKKRKLKCQREI